MRLALCLAVLALVGCKREPACFGLPGDAWAWIEPARFREGHMLGFKAFVLADPPAGGEQLFSEVQRLCAPLRAPDAGPASLQWWIYRETRETPRSLVAGRTITESLDKHQDDLMLEVLVEWKGCRGEGRYTWYKHGYGNSSPDLSEPSTPFVIASGCAPPPR